MKILLVGVETAKLLFNFKNGFLKLGHDVKSCCFGQNKFYSDGNYDWVFPENAFLINGLRFTQDGIPACEPSPLFYEVTKDADIILFLSCRTLFPGMTDLPLLKSMGKKIIVKQTGTDMRWVYPGGLIWNYAGTLFNLAKAEAEYINNMPISLKEMDNFLNPLYRPGLANKLYITCMAALYADVVSAGPVHASLLTSPFFAGINLFANEKLRPHIPGRMKPIIVHAPSNEAYKGTSSILSALEQLQREGVDFELVQARNMPNDKLAQLLQIADIVIDDLACGGHGILANEAMASGCLVLGTNNPQVQPLPRNRPVVPICRENICQQIKRAILDLPFRKRVAEYGVEYIAHGVHSPESGAGYLLDNLERASRKDFDYYPTLFLDNPIWPDYKGYVEKNNIEVYSPDQTFAPVSHREEIPEILQRMLAETVMLHGAHPLTDLHTFSACGLTGDFLQDDRVPRWDAGKLTSVNPWLSIGPNARYGFPATGSIPYSELLASLAGTSA